jgi:hypothetical protein
MTLPTWLGAGLSNNSAHAESGVHVPVAGLRLAGRARRMRDKHAPRLARLEVIEFDTLSSAKRIGSCRRTGWVDLLKGRREVVLRSQSAALLCQGEFLDSVPPAERADTEHRRPTLRYILSGTLERARAAGVTAKASSREDVAVLRVTGILKPEIEGLTKVPATPNTITPWIAGTDARSVSDALVPAFNAPAPSPKRRTTATDHHRWASDVDRSALKFNMELSLARRNRARKPSGRPVPRCCAKLARPRDSRTEYRDQRYQ